MRYHFYTTSEKAWKGMYASIALAKKSVYLEMYIFQNDTKEYDFLSLLERKAREGVGVVLILDAFGSFGVSDGMLASLRAAGAEVLFFSYWFRRLHRKILIIDEMFVFLGGVNIGKAYAPWKDLQVRVSGKRMVGAALRSFVRVYRECGGKRAELLAKGGESTKIAKAKTWFIEHGIGGRWAEIRKQYEDHISKAERNITLVTPYFFPRRWLTAHLHEAILRGVRVEILVPRHTDHKYFFDAANRHSLALLSRLGAEGYLIGEMNHAKAMLIDDSAGMVGSSNLDPLSFGWNAEAGVFFSRPAMVRDLAKILREWKKGAEPFFLERYIPRWYDRFFSLLLKIF